MNYKSALKELLKILQEHVDVPHGLFEKDDPNFTRDPGFLLDFKESSEAIVALLKDEVDLATELDSRVNIREIEPDVLAFYKTFLHLSRNSHADWGVHLNIEPFIKFCKKVKWDSGQSAEDVIAACWLFIFTHEANHFDCDLINFLLLQSRGLYNNNYPPRKSNYFCEHEESLGQTRALETILKKFKIISEAVKASYSGSTNGYGDFKTYWKKTDLGFDEISNHNLAQDCNASNPVALAHTLITRRKFSKDILPVYFHYKVTPVSGVMTLAVPKGIRIGDRVQSRIEKLSKGDKIFHKNFEKTIDLLKQDPHHPSLGTSKFQGVKNRYEVRISKGDRLFIEPSDDGYFDVIDVGKSDELYRH